MNELEDVSMIKYDQNNVYIKTIKRKTKIKYIFGDKQICTEKSLKMEEIGRN